MKAIFFGDAHLKKDSKSELALLLDFVDRHLSDSDYVFMLGDIFEFYHGYDGFIFSWYLPLAEKLRELSTSGKRIFFLEGNHEFSMGSYFEKFTGCKSSRSLSFVLEGIRLYISHGDELTPSILGRILRSRLSKKMMDFLGPNLSWMIASFFSKILSKRRKPKDMRTKLLFRNLALKKLSEGYDVVVLSHSHIPDQLNTGRGIYFNTGDVIVDRTYVEYRTDFGFSLKSLS